MNLPPEWSRHGRQLGPAAVWLIALSVWNPALGVASALLAGAGGLLAKSAVSGIGLAAAAAPFGLWLLDHPGALAVGICALVSWALVWFYRSEIRRAL